MWLLVNICFLVHVYVYDLYTYFSTVRLWVLGYALLPTGGAEGAHVIMRLGFCKRF